MAYLVLVRHGMSQYNKDGMWTGWDDPDLIPEGVEEAKKAAGFLRDIHFDFVYTSVLKRTIQTADEMKKALQLEQVPTISSKELNERNYGVYTAKNKWEIKKEVGEDLFAKIRRSWDFPIDKGESLKQVYERVVPYYTTEILPKLENGKNILLVSSGNALRALVKYLENISDEKIPYLEIATGEIYVYEIGSPGNVIKKEIRNPHPNEV